jgi:hypothetical protein
MVALVLGLASADFLFVPPRFTFQSDLPHSLSLALTASFPLVVLWLIAGSKRAARVLASHDNIAALTKARSAARQARRDEARLVEEVGQRLAAIGLAAHGLKIGGANPEAIATIELALDEARRELKLKGLGQFVEHD